ncbi:MAG: hypothetical protein V7711_08490 [Pseudomonadales bacterium]
MENLLLERIGKSVALLKLNRPQARNALSWQLIGTSRAHHLSHR